MENINVVVKDNQAVITVNLSYRGNLSASGKTRCVASTHGNVKIPGTDVTLGLNAYVKPTV